VLHALAIVLGLTFMVPFFWALSTSLKTGLKTTNIPPPLLPEAPQWRNYVQVTEISPFVLFVRNSVFLTAVNVVVQTAASAGVAYGFARFRFPGRNVLFLLLLSRLMLPGEVTLIPQFVLFHYLGWLDTYLPLIMPHLLGGSSFGVFLMRQFFMTIPREFDDAATVDGASSVQIFWHIIVPLAKPALAALAIFSFIGTWNDFFGPLIYLSSEEKMTLAVGLTWFQAVGFNFPKTNLLLAYALMMTLPVVFVFFCAQRYFVQGVVLSGLKG
jgi:ABC-type glycerol-3-phosphate transport system permease component